MLKPNQRVRRRVLRRQGHRSAATGSIVWASFEMPKGQSPRYRAGIELTPADPDALRDVHRSRRCRRTTDRTTELRTIAWLNFAAARRQFLARIVFASATSRQSNPVADDRFVAIGSGRDDRGGHAAHLFQPLDVVPRLERQLVDSRARRASALSSRAAFRKSASYDPTEARSAGNSVTVGRRCGSRCRSALRRGRRARRAWSAPARRVR